MELTDVQTDLTEILITEEQIRSRIAELARDVERDYAGKDVLLIGVLKGAVMVMADLARELRIPVTMDWMAVSSYGSGTQSSGVVRITSDLSKPVEGKHVLVVEDIVDTGLTMQFLLDNLATRKPASVKICTLLEKPSRAKVKVPIDYKGFVIPDEFVVGFGLDYDEKLRNLPFIGVMRK